MGICRLFFWSPSVPFHRNLAKLRPVYNMQCMRFWYMISMSFWYTSFTFAICILRFLSSTMRKRLVEMCLEDIIAGIVSIIQLDVYIDVPFSESDSAHPIFKLRCFSGCLIYRLIKTGNLSIFRILLNFEIFCRT